MLQNASATAFTISELLRGSKHGVRGCNITHTPLPRLALRNPEDCSSGFNLFAKVAKNIFEKLVKNFLSKIGVEHRCFIFLLRLSVNMLIVYILFKKGKLYHKNYKQRDKFNKIRLMLTR